MFLCNYIFGWKSHFQKHLLLWGNIYMLNRKDKAAETVGSYPGQLPSFQTNRSYKVSAVLCIAECFSGQPCSRESVTSGLHECPLQVVGWDMDRHRSFQASDVVWVGRKLLESFSPSWKETQETKVLFYLLVCPQVMPTPWQLPGSGMSRAGTRRQEERKA